MLNSVAACSGSSKTAVFSKTTTPGRNRAIVFSLFSIFVDSWRTRSHQDGERRVRLHHELDSLNFYSALGEFRGAIGPQVALLAAHYQIDVENELAQTLPLEDHE
jgi:hypothetical protein